MLSLSSQNSEKDNQINIGKTVMHSKSLDHDWPRNGRQTEMDRQ